MVEAKVDLLLYEGSLDGAGELEPQFEATRSSLLLRVQMIRVVHAWSRGRLLLAAASAGARDRRRASRELARLAKELAAERVPYADVFAGELAAGSAVLVGDSIAACAALDRVIAAAGDEMLLHVAAARHRKGELLGGDAGRALVADVEAWMRSEGIVDPARMTSVFLPGRWLVC
jgi:hypothetical protein